jgi:hypothetical protein
MNIVFVFCYFTTPHQVLSLRNVKIDSMERSCKIRIFRHDSNKKLRAD